MAFFEENDSSELGMEQEEGRDQNRSLIVLPVLPFYSSCVQSTLIFSLNFHLIGEWHDKRELVQLNGLIETESTTAAAGALKRTHLQQNKKGRDNSHFGSGKKTFSNLWPFGQNDIISVSAKSRRIRQWMT